MTAAPFPLLTLLVLLATFALLAWALSRILGRPAATAEAAPTQEPPRSVFPGISLAGRLNAIAPLRPEFIRPGQLALQRPRAHRAYIAGFGARNSEESYVVYSYWVGDLEHVFAWETPYDETHRLRDPASEPTWYDRVREGQPFDVEYDELSPEKHRIVTADFSSFNDGVHFIGAYQAPVPRYRDCWTLIDENRLDELRTQVERNIRYLAEQELALIGLACAYTDGREGALSGRARALLARKEAGGGYDGDSLQETWRLLLDVYEQGVAPPPTPGLPEEIRAWMAARS